MIEVECQECPVRNFCPRQENIPEIIQIDYDECPLLRAINKCIEHIEGLLVE